MLKLGAHLIHCRLQVLRVGGKFVFVMANGENMEERIVYDQMRSEERWRDLLDKTRSVIAGSQDVKRP